MTLSPIIIDCHDTCTESPGYHNFVQIEPPPQTPKNFEEQPLSQRRLTPLASPGQISPPKNGLRPSVSDLGKPPENSQKSPGKSGGAVKRVTSSSSIGYKMPLSNPSKLYAENIEKRDKEIEFFKAKVRYYFQNRNTTSFFIFIQKFIQDFH
jgi:hypothetical protein